MLKQVDQMYSSLGWDCWKWGETEFLEKETNYGIEGNNSEIGCTQKIAFYYRDPVTCATYLLRQQCYTSDTVYAPVKETNNEGARMYSEMHTADWWWQIQVS